MDSKQSKRSIIKRLMNSTSPNISLFNSPLLSSLQDKILCYQTSQNMDMQKTYGNFLEIGNSSSKMNTSASALPSRNRKTYRQSYNSINLNDTKIMKKSMKYIKEYQQTLETEEETHSHIKSTEGTLIRNFSLAKFLLQKIRPNFQNVIELITKNFTDETKSGLYDKEQTLNKFNLKCETMKENIQEILNFIQKEKEIAQNFDQSPFPNPKNLVKNWNKPHLQLHPILKNFEEYQSEIQKAFKLYKKKNIEEFEENFSQTSVTSPKFSNFFARPAISIFKAEEEKNEGKSNFFIKSPKSQMTCSMEVSQIIAPPPQNANKLQTLKENYDKFLTNLITMVQSRNMRELYVSLMIIHAKICLEVKDTYKGIAILKQAKSISSELNFPYCRLKCYEKLGRAFQILKNFRLSLRFFLKMLEMSFICGADHKELQAYDLIGIQFYYQGKTDIADFFHKKLLEGEIEPEDSNLRKIAKRKYSLKVRTSNYCLPGYIAARTTHMNYENIENDSSDDEDDLKVEEILGKYKEPEDFWKALENKRTATMRSGGPINMKEIVNKANKNIRPAKHDRRSLDLSDFHYKIKANEAQEQKPFLRINHLSPNRYYANPNIYEFKMNKLSKEDTQKLSKRVVLIGDRVFEKMMRKFQGVVEKLKNNLRVTLMQIEFYLTKIRDSGSHRKKGLFCSPLLRKSLMSDKKMRLRTSTVGKKNKNSVIEKII